MKRTKASKAQRVLVDGPVVGETGVKVVSRDGIETGLTTGATRTCGMEGCLGRRVCVKWPDGKVTYPCTKGMIVNGKKWRIG